MIPLFEFFGPRHWWRLDSPRELPGELHLSCRCGAVALLTVTDDGDQWQSRIRLRDLGEDPIYNEDMSLLVYQVIEALG